MVSRSAALSPRSAHLLPILALTLNALVWGTSWWPFRRLEASGLHPLLTTAIVFGLSGLVVLAWRPGALGQLWRSRALWVLALAAGTTNAAFNWAVVIGDVVRVVLLFYLMPLWAVLLARLLLGERLTRQAAVRVALSLGGALIVLWPEGAGSPHAWPLPRSLADWLGVLGGFTFALNNVLLRREAAQPEESRAFAMFFGGSLVALVAALTLLPGAQGTWPRVWAFESVAIMVALSAVFLISNFSLQYGAARLPANLTAVVMLTEVLFAAGSSLAFGDGVLHIRLVLGGALIVAGAALAALESRVSG